MLVPPSNTVFDTLAYHRVSTEDQARQERTSIPEQRKATSDKAAQLGRVIESGAAFEDLGASGATAEGRPGFMAMIAYCEAHPRASNPGIVLVLNDSRFGRFDDRDEAWHWRYVLKKLGWIVRFCEGDDLEDGVARDVVRLIGSAQATEYRTNLRRTALRATRAAAEEGRWQNKAPFGYRRLATRNDGSQRVLESAQRKSSDEITRLTLGPEIERDAVRFAFETYATGKVTLSSLVRMLEERFPVRQWVVKTLNDTLKNPAYMGDVVWCRRPADKGLAERGPERPKEEWVVVTDAHPAIVSRDTFAAVQLVFAQHRRETRATAGGYPLSGFITCSVCGKALVGGGGRHGPADDPDRFRVYRDGSAYLRKNPCPGTILMVSKRWLESAVIGAISEVVRDPSVQRVIADEIDRAIAAAMGTSGDRHGDLEREREAIGQQRKRIVDAIAKTILTDREAAVSLAELRSRAEAIDAELERLRFSERRLDGAAALRDRLLTTASQFEATAARVTGPELRELLRPWIYDATIDKPTRRLRLVIRRVPDVFGAPWAEIPAAAHRVAGASKTTVGGGIDSPASRTADGQNNRRARLDPRLVVVRTISLPRRASVRPEQLAGLKRVDRDLRDAFKRRSGGAR